MTPPSHTAQPAPCFTSADVKRYQRRLEEGYDVPDPHYSLWLQRIGINPACAHSTTQTSAEASNETPDDASKSLCQTGDCGHQERACGLPATSVRGGITASVLECLTRKPSPSPTHALLAPRHAIPYLQNHVNAHSLAVFYL